MTDQLPATPAERFSGLFEMVQQAAVFPDSKTFCDLLPLFDDAVIMRAFQEQSTHPDFDPSDFINQNFERPQEHDSGYTSEPGLSAREHITRLWPFLERRDTDIALDRSSRIPLPFPYVVPGGRFQEIYYWDSYFTFLGLMQSGAVDMVKNMVSNFAWLIDRFGCIPNGNRSYFLSRSQPPFFALMVRLLAEQTGDKEGVYRQFGPALLKEYRFWMDGEHQLTEPGQSYRRVVALGGKAVLNRYWDDCPEPRQESWREDMHLAVQSDRTAEDLWRDLRAACESGWDFSSRWLRDPSRLDSIRTTSLLPVDLNCLLYELESTLCEASGVVPSLSKYRTAFEEAASARAEMVRSLFWHPDYQTFVDWDTELMEPADPLTLAMAFPLFSGLATQEQAGAVAQMIASEFLKPGGLVTTPVHSGQQWDAPNGWAPLQWVTICGLKNYGYHQLAGEATRRWLALNDAVFNSTGKMMEKYQVVIPETPAGGGEYPNQDGFGWTNGVYMGLLSLPEETDNKSRDHQ